MRKVAKVLLIGLFLCLIVIFALFLYVVITISKIDNSQMLNLDKLNNINAQIKIYDDNNENLVTTSSSGVKTISLNDLPEYVPKAFISIEDKKFYNHNGLNYGRIIKAGVKNIFSGSTKEGASTITQQLIKNTHLTSEKTMTRKIQEAYLALKLEKQYTKSQILETYLNVIYFGNSAYGLESASQTYFDKSAKDLTIAESATLAGLIKSPRTYSPLHNPEKCKSRRDLVLKNMLDDKIITQTEYNEAISTPLIALDLDDINHILNKQILQEATKILDISETDISTSGYKIYTYINKTIQDELATIYNNNIDNAIIVIDNKTNGVLGYLGNGEQKRQTGSTIKPFLSYAPAFEKGLLSPATPINDEKTNFAGYSPKNANNKYLGWTDVRTSLVKSLNVPAVKCLEYSGIQNSINIAKKFGFEFSNNDNHLAIALGATAQGFSIQEVANAYSALSRNGQYEKLKFIKEIKDNKGKTVYKAKNDFHQAVSTETAYLLNDILKETKSIGTAKKLSVLNLENLCAKTGTVGTKNNQNSDAWCVSYTPEYTALSWFGNTSANPDNNLAQNQNGGTISASQSVKVWDILKKHYNINKDFKKPANIVEVSLDSLSLENQKLELASDKTPQRFIVKDIFNKKYIPKTESKNFSILTAPILSLQSTQNQLKFSFEGLSYLSYELIQIQENQETKIALITGEDETMYYEIQKPTKDTEYYLKIKYSNPTFLDEAKSNIVKIKVENETNQTTFEKIKGWFTRKST